MGTDIHALSPSHSFCLFFSLSLTLRWRGRSYVRPSWVTCRSQSQNGRGRTLFSGPGERRFAGWGLDSANPEGCDSVTRHFLLRSWSARRKGKVLRLERIERKRPAKPLARWKMVWNEVVSKPVSICLCDGDAWRDAEGKSCWPRHIV